MVSATLVGVGATEIKGATLSVNEPTAGVSVPGGKSVALAAKVKSVM